MTSDVKMTLRGTVAEDDTATERLLPGPTPIVLITQLEMAAIGTGTTYTLSGPRLSRQHQSGDSDVPTGEPVGTYWVIESSSHGSERVPIAEVQTPASDPLGPIQSVRYRPGADAIAVAAVVIETAIAASRS